MEIQLFRFNLPLALLFL